jgi:hypothetical protein
MNREPLKTLYASAPGRLSQLETPDDAAESSVPAKPETTIPKVPAASCSSRFKSISFGATESYVPRHPPAVIALEHALHIKSAEFWLRLGEPLEALAEIEGLPLRVRMNSWVHKLHAAATWAAREFQAGSV